jgi:hypothetical protein
MRHTLIRCLLTVAALALVAPVGLAEAREPVTDPLGSDTPNGSITLPATRCPFPVHIAVVTNNEFQESTTLSDGTTITKITGKLVLSFSNANPGGRTIVRNVSGPSIETDNPDGTTGTVVDIGNSWNAFGPLSQPNIPSSTPHLMFSSGLVIIKFATTNTGIRFVTRLSVLGHEEDGCALLG